VVDRWLTRRRLAGSVLSVGLLAACGLGIGFVPIPTQQGEPGKPILLPDDVAIAAVVAGDDHGYVLSREGHVLLLGADGSLDHTAVVGPYMTPFGALAGGRAVFGGLRCEGDGCRTRVAEVVTLDADGRIEAVTAVARSERRPSSLNGLALVGVDEGSVWVNGGGHLFRVDPGGRIEAEVPWPGGEPCVIGGVLHDLSATGGTYAQRGEEIPSDSVFDLQVQAWDGGADEGAGGWRRVDGGSADMRAGSNAYCAPGGYEVRDGRSTTARWTPTTGWRTRSTAGAVPDGGWGAVAPVTSSTGRRYVPAADGSVLDVSRPGSVRATGVALPGLVASDMPPAVEVDDAGSSLLACATTYRAAAEEAATTRCLLAPKASPVAGRAAATPASRTSRAARTERAARTPELLAGAAPAGRRDGVHHYNMCSAACGSAVRSHTRDVVAWLVGQRRPAALSLNEVCYDDGVQLAGRWPDGFGAGTAYAALESAVNCPGAVKRMGNQVVVAGEGDPPGSWAELATQPGDPCRRSSWECRGVACADARRAGGRVSVCTAHLEPPRGDRAVTETQAREYLATVVDGSRPAVPTVAAGDFNLGRDDVDRWFGDAGFVAAPAGPTMVGRDGASDEIDVIYHQRDGAGSAAEPSAARYCDRQASDHCYLTAAFTSALP
jgi:hypothetical protein